MNYPVGLLIQVFHHSVVQRQACIDSECDMVKHPWQSTIPWFPEKSLHNCSSGQVVQRKLWHQARPYPTDAEAKIE